MKIVADAEIPYVQEYFAPLGELILKFGRSIKNADVKDADILLVRSVTEVNQTLLEGSTIQFVGSLTAGTDHLDLHYLKSKQIAFANIKGFNAPPVSDYVISVIAALKQQQLIKSLPLKVAIIGVGHVGKLVYERFKKLGFDIVLTDPYRAENEKDFSSTPLQELTDLDLITIHVPLTKGGRCPTHHFIDKNFITRQKPGCVILNASRGGVIHSQDILQYGDHLIWCLDVFEHEPHFEKKLLEVALITTPHIAGYSVQSKIRGIDMLYQIACREKIIKPQVMSPITIPAQVLRFADRKMNWCEAVLGIFNPLLMTQLMKENFRKEGDDAPIFDEMRKHFNYRHEFSFTTLDCQLSDEDRKIINGLGILLVS